MYIISEVPKYVPMMGGTYITINSGSKCVKWYVYSDLSGPDLSVRSCSSHLRKIRKSIG